MSCFYLSIGSLAGHTLVFKEETVNSGCWCIWIHAHLERRRWFPFKDIFFLTTTEMQSTRQSSFQLNSNLSVIFTTSPRDTRETCHLRPAQRRTDQQSVPQIHGQCWSMWTLLATSGTPWKADGQGFWGWGLGFFPRLDFACQKPFCADV